MATVVTAKFDDGQEDRYFMPVAMTSAHAEETLQQAPDGIVARIAGATKGVLHGWLDADVARELFAAIAEERRVELRHGQLVASRFPAFEEVRAQAPDADLTPALPSIERANSSIRFGERYVLKLVRRLWRGPSHEAEIGLFLSERAHFTRAPRLAGTLEVRPTEGAPAVAGLLHAFVPHQMDGWRLMLGELERYFESAVAWDAGQAQVDQAVELSTASIPEAARRTVGGALESVSTLGRRTAELHLTLAGDEAKAAFGTASIDSAWIDALAARAKRQAETTLAALSSADPSMPFASPMIDALAASRDRLMATVDNLARRVTPGLQLTRIHGAYDLGQVLLSEGDFVIIDFEGDPALPMDERRTLNTPVRDVANMARSFQYAAGVALSARITIAPQDAERMRAWARWWHTWTTVSFLNAYQSTAAGAAFLPADPGGHAALVKLLLIEQSLIEIRRELAARPEYVWIPLQAVVESLEAGKWKLGS